MTRLKRRASQELLPTRAPKLARGQDPNVLSRLSEGINTTVKFIASNVSAFYEGIYLPRLTLAYVMRFRSSCPRGRDPQVFSSTQTISPTSVAYTSQTGASGYPKRVPSRATTFRWALTPVFLHAFAHSQAWSYPIISSSSPSASPDTRVCRYPAR
jgi:hypothetical protein